MGFQRLTPGFAPLVAGQEAHSREGIVYKMTSGSSEAQAATFKSSFNDRVTIPDSENPKRWSNGKKRTITVVASLMTFSVTFASSIFSTAERQTAAEFHVSHEVMILGLSLFMLVSDLTLAKTNIIRSDGWLMNQRRDIVLVRCYGGHYPRAMGVDYP